VDLEKKSFIGKVNGHTKKKETCLGIFAAFYKEHFIPKNYVLSIFYKSYLKTGTLFFLNIFYCPDIYNQESVRVGALISPLYKSFL